MRRRPPAGIQAVRYPQTAHRTLLAWLASTAVLAACGAVASIAGTPTIATVTVLLPAGVLVGDTVRAAVIAKDAEGNTKGWPATWRSSDPTVASVDAQGRVVGLAGGRQATISAEVGGKTGSATISVVSDDNRIGYALADQPGATGPYIPDPAYRYNSSGGAVQITRASDGVYSVRFSGLGRASGQRDNVQVSGFGGASAVYCKPNLWDASGSDLVTTVSCFGTDGSPTDSRFTILVLGARAFGRATPLAFALSVADTGTIALDTSVTAYNSTGGSIYAGHVSEGSVSMQFKGLEPAWGSGPVAILATAVGQGLRRCRAFAVDASTASVGIGCVRLSGAPGDSPFSLLWVSRVQPTQRIGFAWGQNEASTAGYSPDPAYSFNSSGGVITARRTGPGEYSVVFAGLAPAAGATETVMVAPFQFSDRICSTTSWAKTGVNDLTITVACFDATGAHANTRFELLVLQAG